jgi:biotin carboxyl carrier protein
MAAVTRVGRGVYRVEHDGRQDLVYVASDRGHTWAFCNGQVFHDAPTPAEPQTEPGRGTANSEQQGESSGKRLPGMRTLVSPMPATIVKIIGVPGAPFKRGDTLVVVEAMKMELPISAEHDGVVKAVHCQEGDLVQAGQTLIELE